MLDHHRGDLVLILVGCAIQAIAALVYLAPLVILQNGSWRRREGTGGRCSRRVRDGQIEVYVV